MASCLSHTNLVSGRHTNLIHSELLVIIGCRINFASADIVCAVHRLPNILINSEQTVSTGGRINSDHSFSNTASLFLHSNINSNVNETNMFRHDEFWSFRCAITGIRVKVTTFSCFHLSPGNSICITSLCLRAITLTEHTPSSALGIGKAARMAT